GFPDNVLPASRSGAANVISPNKPQSISTSGRTDSYIEVLSGTNNIVNPYSREAGGGVNLLALEAAKTNNVLFVDGVRYRSLAQALAGCPVEGCTIDMRGNSSSSALLLGNFDPGKRAVTILLGPYRYTATQITLRTNLQIIGYGSGT